jgi:hypothetical protein
MGKGSMTGVFKSQIDSMIPTSLSMNKATGENLQ